MLQSRGEKGGKSCKDGIYVNYFEKSDECRTAPSTAAFVTAESTAGEDHGAFPNGTVPLVGVNAHSERGCLAD